MIESEGYKAFRGTMKITPKCVDREPFTEYADWLYKPEYNCWYGNGRSFMAEICEIVEDETKRRNKRLVQMLDNGETVESYLYIGGNPCGCGSNCYHLEYDGNEMFTKCNACGIEFGTIKPEYIAEMLNKGKWVEK